MTARVFALLALVLVSGTAFGQPAGTSLARGRLTTDSGRVAVADAEVTLGARAGSRAGCLEFRCFQSLERTHSQLRTCGVRAHCRRLRSW